MKFQAESTIVRVCDIGRTLILTSHPSSFQYQYFLHLDFPFSTHLNEPLAKQ